MAVMLDALELRRGQRVLEIGAGTGYNASLIAKIVGDTGSVTAIDIDPDLVSRARRAIRRAGSRARVVAGDGYAGVARYGPYDRVIATASTSVVPRAWWEQLVPDGLLEVPLILFDNGGWQSQQVVVFRRTEAGFRSVVRNPGGFMAMRGSSKDPAPVISTPSIGAFTIDRRKGGTRYPAFLTGKPIRGLGDEEAARLVRLVLGKPRVERIAPPASSGALQTFLALSLPKDLLVTFASLGRTGTGVLGSQLEGVAVTARKNRGATDLLAFGARSAEKPLRAAIESWRAAGSPRDRDLEIAVTFDRKPVAWRVFKRGDCYIALNWRRGGRHP